MVPGKLHGIFQTGSLSVHRAFFFRSEIHAVIALIGSNGQYTSSPTATSLLERKAAIPRADRCVSESAENSLLIYCCWGLTTSFPARIWRKRRPSHMPKGKHVKEIAASTENHTVSSRVLPWSKKPIKRMMDEVYLGTHCTELARIAILPKEFNAFLEAFRFRGRSSMI